MTIDDRCRTHPVAAHTYTLPIVREIPVHAGIWSGSGTEQYGRPLASAAGSHAW